MSKHPTDHRTPVEPDADDLVDQAGVRLEDAEDQFGPDAPRRGATPGNEAAEEAPTNEAAHGAAGSSDS